MDEFCICLLIFFSLLTVAPLFWQMQVLRHSEHTLKTALISKNPELVAQYEKFGTGERRLMNEAFQPSSSLFEPITVHSQSDWITSHPEAPQDFEQFFTARYRNTPCPEKHIIYIQSIGMFWEWWWPLQKHMLSGETHYLYTVYWCVLEMWWWLLPKCK